MKRIRIYTAVLLITALAANAIGCSAEPGTNVPTPIATVKNVPTPIATVKAVNLMNGISSDNVSGRDVDNEFSASIADFSIELFKKSISGMESSLISPLSVLLALAMTANGARGETLAQMEELLGGGIPLEELNEYLYSYMAGLPSTEGSRLHSANSIWFREDLSVEDEFLQTNADFYNAAAYSSAFDEQTETDVNNWVNLNTDGMIERILNDGDIEQFCMILINAIAFEAEWQNVYHTEDIRNGTFTDINNKTQNVRYMHSNEWKYLEDGSATGFIKPYTDGYSFVALLPNEGVPIDEYIESLTGEGFLDTLRGAQHTTVSATMPKFEYAYSIMMKEPLIDLGIPDAFDSGRADFKRIVASPGIWIDEVLHKTFISVDELGTRAGAVTMVAMTSGGMMPSEIKTVTLDRPFVYAIIDNATSLPIFIGTLLTVH